MRKNVIICHGSHSSALVLDAMLSDAGFSTTVVGTLGYLREKIKAQTPHLVVIGCELDDGSGIDFCKRFKSAAETSHIPVFIVTSEPSVKKSKESFFAGAEQMLALPTTEEIFLTKVYAALHDEEKKKYSEIGDNHAYTVLIAEDSPSVLNLYKSILSEHTCEVIGCPDGKAAWSALTRRSAEVDLIISDIFMPEWDGKQFIRTVRSDKRFNKIPIIIATAEERCEVLEDMFEIGANDYFVKPINPVEFLCRIKAHLRTRYLIDQQSALTRELNLLNSNLESRVKKRTMELQYSNMAALNMLAMAAEYKDDSTGFHIQRVRSYAEAIAHKLGVVDHHLVEEIGYSSIMHDVGKIGIPESILGKPGKLNDEEWQIMKTHSELGYSILSKNSFFKLAADIALHHHEHWDGNGYPHGLKGEAIPLAARITAASDVLDALLSRRCYKEPFSIEKTIGIIKEEQGSHFDPNVVDAILELFKEGALQKIIDRYPYSDEG
jgi:putative two-component system response regulator